jgi:hypothetical protein
LRRWLYRRWHRIDQERIAPAKTAAKAKNLGFRLSGR